MPPIEAKCLLRILDDLCRLYAIEKEYYVVLARNVSCRFQLKEINVGLCIKIQKDFV